MSTLLLIFLTALPYWQNPNVNAIHREPARANYVVQDTLSLNGSWDFQFDDGAWGTMPVPGCWELNGCGLPFYRNIGYVWKGWYQSNPPFVPDSLNYHGLYRREFTIPPSWRTQTIYLCIGAITSNALVTINGKEVGYSEDSKLAAHFNITPYIHKGINTLEIYCQRWCDGTYLEDQDFWRFTGISRDVYLYARPKSHVSDFFIHADWDVKKQQAMLSIDGITGENLNGCTINISLYDDTTCILHTPLSALPFTCRSIKPWTAETPNLYTLLITLSKSGRTIETIRQHIGFRHIEIKNNQLLVNGQPILIKGVNRHELDPYTGYVVSPERMLSDIAVIKQFNFNAIRTSHYPDDPYFYDLCDRYGIYVLAEANVEGHGVGRGKEHGIANDPNYQQTFLERNQNHVITLKNHPSIIIWSLGNETGDGNNFTYPYQWIHAYDPSRPVHYEESRNGSNSDFYCPMYASIERMIRNHGHVNKPMIECEYMHAMGNSEGGFKEYWDMFRQYPKMQGGFVWDFADQGLACTTEDGRKYYAYAGDYEPVLQTDHNFNCNGLFAPDRTPNPHAYEAKYVQQNIWTTLKDTAAGIISIYNENFFSDLSNVRLQWSLMTNGEEIQSGEITHLDVPAQSTKEYQLALSNWQQHIGDKEVILTVRYYTQKEYNLVPANHEIAHQQFILSPFRTCSLIEQDAVLQHSDLISEEKPAPCFWRAPTDNDYGMKIPVVSAVWRHPQLQLVSSDFQQTPEGRVETIVYTIAHTGSTLTITYTYFPSGIIHVQEHIVMDEKDPSFLRFGMEWVLPKSLEYITYYGRGPWENYPDRNSAALIGIYHQSVTEQYYPYIRPQETGTKTDVRWWQLTDKDGHGVRITAPKPFLASALHYTIESLDDGEEKTAHQSHGSLVPQTDATILHIDGFMQGVAGDNSWGAKPLKQYRLPAGEYDWEFYIEAL